MSGFEIAGIVLGGFPILLEGTKVLRGRYKDLGTWWQFEREFESFVSAVEREHIAFSQILEILLEPIANLAREKRDMLLSNPQSRRWFDSDVQWELRQRIQPRYHEWFMRQLGAVKDALDKVHLLLPIGKAYHLDGGRVESEMFRLKTSFSHESASLLITIKETNQSLYNFLDRASHVSRTTTPEPSARDNYEIVTSILDLQKQARCLFTCFQRHWTCNCTPLGGHSCGITAHSEGLKMTFSSAAAERTHVKVEMVVTSPPPQDPACTPGPNKSEEVFALSRQIAVKKRMKKLRETGNKGIRILAASTLSVFSSSVPLGEGTYEGLEKPQEKVRKRRVAFDLPSPAATATGTQPGPARLTLPHTAATITARAARTGAAIKDICAATRYRGATSPSCLGFLEPDRDTQLFLYLEPSAQQQPIEPASFQAFLTSTPRRDARLRLGHATILTILKLGPAWVPKTLSKASVLCLPGEELDGTSAVYQPYLSHASIHETLQTAAAASTQKARASLLALGILLLELLFCETLEQQPFRAGLLGPEGPNELTDLCTALMWQKQAEEQFGHTLADAIRCCLVCAFENPDLESRAFVQAMWTSVIKPIEEFLRVYS